MGDDMIRIWTRNSFEVDLNLLYLMLISIAISSIWYTSLVALTATNHHQRVSTLYLTVSILSLFLVALALPKHGLPGAAAASLVAEIFLSAFIVQNSLRLLGDSLVSYLKFIVVPPIFKIL
jgi:hypothetical protein